MYVKILYLLSMACVGDSVLMFNFIRILNESYYAVKHNCRKLHVATRAG